MHVSGLKTGTYVTGKLETIRPSLSIDHNGFIHAFGEWAIDGKIVVAITDGAHTSLRIERGANDESEYSTYHPAQAMVKPDGSLMLTVWIQLQYGDDILNGMIVYTRTEATLVLS